MSLSVMEITSRLAKDAVFMTDLEKAFVRKLEEKQGAIPLYRRMSKDFSATELEDMPLPGSKPPEQQKGESNADYAKRLAGSNDTYDYYPQTTRNAQKIPAGYIWNDIADGLNNENVEKIADLGKLTSSKASVEDKAAVRAKSDLYKGKSSAQLESMLKTAKDRRGTFRTLVKRAFELYLQIERIQDDYPSVEVSFHTVPNGVPDADGNVPIETTSAPILIQGLDAEGNKTIFGEAVSVASFLRFNVDKALANGGTLDDLLKSGGKEKPPETPTGEGGGRATYGADDLDSVFGTLAFTLEDKLGKAMLAAKLSAKDEDAKDFILSFGRTFHAMTALFVGTMTSKRYEKFIREEEEAEEAAKLARKAELEAALAKGGKAA